MVNRLFDYAINKISKIRHDDAGLTAADFTNENFAVTGNSKHVL